MADLIIKPSAVGNQRLVFADQAGNTLLRTGDGSSETSELNSGLLQIKQFRKLTVFDLPSGGTTTVLPAPFDGTATITPSVAGNFIRAKFQSCTDHGTTWRSGVYIMVWAKESDSYFEYGLTAAANSTWGSSPPTHGNSNALVGMFNPNTTAKCKVKIIWQGHASGPGRRHGQYNYEGEDNTNNALSTDHSQYTVGAWLILEEWAAATCTTTDVA